MVDLIERLQTRCVIRFFKKSDKWQRCVEQQQLCPPYNLLEISDRRVVVE